MHGDRRDIEENEALRHLVGHVPGNRRSLNLQALRDSDDITIIKTHDVPSNYMSVEDTVFYIVRDGRDATVSLQRHARDFADQEVPLQDIIAGKRNFGFWGNHIVQWHDADFRRIHSFRFFEGSEARSPCKGLSARRLQSGCYESKITWRIEQTSRGVPSFPAAEGSAG